MSGDKRTLLKQWLANGKASLQPLTFPQRELWEASPVSVTDSANHICCLIHLRGVIAQQACEAALQRVVERQEVLRLSFLPGKDRPVQMIRQSSEANFRFRELSPAQGHQEAVEELAKETFSEAFDLVRGPLYRVEVLRRSADEHVLVFAIHHAIADGWTLGVFVQDLCMAYVQGLMGLHEGLPPVPLTYAEWGADERTFWQPAELERRAAFWKSNLAGSCRLWNSLEGPQTASGAHHRLVSLIPVDLANAARELARVAGATLFSTMLTAFQVALSRWTGEGDVLVGTPVANRTRQSSRETMGYFAGIVPLRGQVDAHEIRAAVLCRREDHGLAFRSPDDLRRSASAGRTLVAYDAAPDLELGTGRNRDRAAVLVDEDVGSGVRLDLLRIDEAGERESRAVRRGGDFADRAVDVDHGRHRAAA